MRIVIARRGTKKVGGVRGREGKGSGQGRWELVPDSKESIKFIWFVLMHTNFIYGFTIQGYWSAREGRCECLGINGKGDVNAWGLMERGL